MENEKLTKKLAALELQIKELKDEVQLKNQCLSLIAHDFSGVSRNLLWILNSLKDGDISYEVFQSLYPEIKNNVLNNNKTIEATVAWVNSQHHSFQTHPVEIKLLDLLSSVENSLKEDLKNKSISLSFQGNKSILVSTDRVLITFILKNIIENAIKYSYHGSNITFEVQQIENEHISLIIEDSGIGMSKQIVENLFTLQGSPYTGTANEIGAGLSLVIANDFIKLIGGTINVYSEENKGTRIELQLPGLLKPKTYD